MELIRREATAVKKDLKNLRPQSRAIDQSDYRIAGGGYFS